MDCKDLYSIASGKDVHQGLALTIPNIFAILDRAAATWIK